MAFENAAFSATLTAAAGDDPALMSELRGAFRESLAQHIDLLRQEYQKLKPLAA